MLELKCRKYDEAELSEIAQLFYTAFSRDKAFTAAFPDEEARLEHLKKAVSSYAAAGEIHTAREDDRFTAAALWSLPYQRVPSPVYDFDIKEPCCKLYMLASVKPSMGSALMHFALFRYETPPLLLVCTTAEQESFFSRFGFVPKGRTSFGTVMRNDREILLKKDCDKC